MTTPSRRTVRRLPARRARGFSRRTFASGPVGGGSERGSPARLAAPRVPPPADGDLTAEAIGPFIKREAQHIIAHFGPESSGIVFGTDHQASLLDSPPLPLLPLSKPQPSSSRGRHPPARADGRRPAGALPQVFYVASATCAEPAVLTVREAARLSRGLGVQMVWVQAEEEFSQVGSLSPLVACSAAPGRTTHQDDARGVPPHPPTAATVRLLWRAGGRVSGAGAVGRR